jgi:hypothetical protein
MLDVIGWVIFFIVFFWVVFKDKKTEKTEKGETSSINLGETHVILGQEFKRITTYPYFYYECNGIGFYADQSNVYYYISGIIPINQEEFIRRLEAIIDQKG